MPRFYLLTHPREISRPSNTGRLLLQAAPALGLDVQRVIWHRTAPEPLLQALCARAEAVLLYPGAATDAEAGALPTAYAHFVLLDGTWQESAKMLRQSPYLQQAPRLSLPPQPSRYQLRANQRPGSLCTLESLAALLLQLNQPAQAAQLQLALQAFQSAPQPLS